MSFAAELNFGRDAYPKFKRDEIMTGFNLSVEGMKFTFHCGKMDTATGLVLSHDPISHKAIVQFEAKPHLQEVDVYGLHKDGKIVLLGKCSGTDPLYTAEAREHIAAGEKRRFAASVAIATMHDEPPEYEIVEYMKTKKARTSRSLALSEAMKSGVTCIAPPTCIGSAAARRRQSSKGQPTRKIRAGARFERGGKSFERGGAPPCARSSSATASSRSRVSGASGRSSSSKVSTGEPSS